MAIKITRAEYEKKFGEKPNISSQQTQKKSEPFVNKVANFLGAKGLTDQYGAQIAKAFAKPEEKKYVEFPSEKEVLGSMVQTGANFLPGAGRGAGLLAKAAVGTGTGYAIDVGSKLQQNKSMGEVITPGLATAVGTSIPVAGAVAKPVANTISDKIIRPSTRFVGRLLKGLGSGTSGVSTETIDKIIQNPQIAQEASNRLAKSGNAKVLEDNARVIVNGISNVRREARETFGKGLQELKKEDIDPKLFREGVKNVLDKVGSVVKGNTRTLSKAEFVEPKNLKTANKLINRLSKVDLDGLSVRRLLDDIESERYKVATSDERLAFNAFLKDLHEGIRNAVNGSTNKLKDINEKFTGDMQLVETMQNVFGKVKFKNLPEVVRASQKLEGIFAQKGLAPDKVDDFLTRIGVSPNEFKTTEAVRQISQKSPKANEPGVGLGEMMRSVTSAIMTPEKVRDIAIKTGLAKEKVPQVLKEIQSAVPNMDAIAKLSPLARNVFLQMVAQFQE